MLQVIFVELQGASNVKSQMTTAQVLVTLAALASLGYLVYASQEVVMTGLLGVGIGVLLSPLLTYAQKKFRLPRALSAVIFLILFLGFTTLFILMIRYLV